MNGNIVPGKGSGMLSLLIFLLGLYHCVSAADHATALNNGPPATQTRGASATDLCAALPLNGTGTYISDQDVYFSGLDVRVNTYAKQQVHNTSEPELFLLDREGQIVEFEISLPCGWYTVSLYFAELDKVHQESGRRVFDVSMQGQLVLPRFDIFRVSGGPNAAYTASMPVVVNSSNLLKLRLDAVVGRAKVNAIRVGPLIHDGELDVVQELGDRMWVELVWGQLQSWWHTSWCKWFLHLLPLLLKEVWLAGASIPGEPRIIISLTTSPKRIAHIAPVIASLQTGSLKPAIIIVNLPFVFLRDGSTFGEIPQFLLSDPMIKINRCEDIGPATKILGTLPLIENPDALILAVDDDILYPRHHLKKVYLKSLEFPGRVVTGRGAMPDYMLEGFSGVLYKRSFFSDHLDLSNRIKALPRYCNLADDLVLSNYMLNKGLQIVRCYTDYEGIFLRQFGLGLVALDYGLRSDALHYGADMTSVGNQNNYKMCRTYLESEGDLYPGYPAYFPFRNYRLKRPDL